MAVDQEQRLNVDMSLPGAEDRLAELQAKVIEKLTKGYGYELQDDTLSVWIIQIAVRNNSPKQDVQKDLVEFIDTNAEDFSNWLWDEVAKV